VSEVAPVVVVALSAAGLGVFLVTFRPTPRRGVVALAALAGFLVGLVATFTVVLLVDIQPGCDLPCGRWSPVITYAGGVLGAILFALAAWWLSARFCAKPS